MDASRYKTLMPLLLVALLLGLLAVLAGLQYRWLGQISDAERSRLRTRLSEDTVRFAEDFNKEVQLAYFNFQASPDSFREGESKEFAKRYLFWTSNTKYPDLLDGVYFYKKERPQDLIRYDPDKGSFVSVPWNPRLEDVRSRIGDGNELKPVLGDQAALAVPVYKDEGEVSHLIVRTKKILHNETLAEGKPPEVAMPDKYGFLVVLLNRKTISENVFPELVSRYFSDSDSANYELAVQDQKGESIFRMGNGKITNPDATISLFNIKPNNFTFFGVRSPAREGPPKNGEKTVVVSEKYEASTASKERSPARDSTTVDVNIVGEGPPRMTVFESKGTGGTGAWTLKVQHKQGSLDQFVANTRRNNLAVSFGILFLLAISMILIFVSSQRAKALARNQLEFVSAVSHEFRTPLAVIYSAAENLSDGVIEEKGKISDYGSLIKREGKKLSGMVEQILEFAGARSGKRRYDFRHIDVAGLVEKALDECAPQIEESGFEIEREINREVPIVSGDELALTQAVQNLVSNALKYSNGSRWMKVSVENGAGEVKIAVEDRGIGISQKDRRHIFEPFYRAANVVDEQISGNGLGLSLVRQIVQAHNGSVSVESEPGKGSRFVITLKADGGEQ